MMGRENKNQENLPSQKGMKSCAVNENGGAQKKSRSRRKQKNGAGLQRLAMLVFLAVFALSLWRLSEILIGYYTAISSYDDIAAHMGQETAPAPPRTEMSEEKRESDKEQKKDQENQKPADSPAQSETDPAGNTNSQQPVRLTVPDFTYLTEINSEVVGWIQIPGTKINYPIVQGSDNEYYLTHTFSGTENSSGAIFLDCAISAGLEDKNPIIYGHNLKSGAMFSRLNRYARREFWDANPYLYITTPQGQRRYQIFSAYQTDAGADIYYFGFGSDDVFQEYLDRIRSYSLYDAGISVTSEDSIITLSTCANDTDQRFVVHAKRIQN